MKIRSNYFERRPKNTRDYSFLPALMLDVRNSLPDIHGSIYSNYNDWKHFSVEHKATA